MQTKNVGEWQHSVILTKEDIPLETISIYDLLDDGVLINPALPALRSHSQGDLIPDEVNH